MENGSFSSPEFFEFTKSVVPFLHVQSNIEGRENDSMLRVYGGRGFPTLRFLDASGDAVATPGRSVESFVKTSKALAAVADLKAQIKAGKKGLGPKLLIAEMELGSVNFEDAKKRVAAFKKLKPEMKAKLEKMLLNAEIGDLMKSVNSQEAQQKVGAQLAKMAKAGRIPTGDTADRFWQFVAGWAAENSDAPLLEKGYEYLQKRYSEEPGAAKYLKNLEDRLAEIKKGDEPDA